MASWSSEGCDSVAWETLQVASPCLDEDSHAHATLPVHKPAVPGEVPVVMFDTNSRPGY